MANIAFNIVNAAGQSLAQKYIDNLDQSYGQQVVTEGYRPTFSAGSLAYTPQATPQTVYQILGSNTKTVRLLKVGLWAASTAAGSLPVNLRRVNPIDTSGTPVALTIAKHDVNSPAATAVINTYSGGAPTAGTNAGVFRTGILHSDLLTNSSVFNYGLIWDFALQGDMACVIRGAADSVCVNFAGGTLVGGFVMNAFFTWVEDNS